MKTAVDYNRTMESAKYRSNKQWPAVETDGGNGEPVQ